MTRINAVNYETAEGKTKELLDGVNKQLGFVPNLMKTAANSPTVLEAYLNLSKTLGTTLNAKLREEIALITAEENECGYCAAAHTAIGKMVGLTDEQTLAAREGKGDNAKSEAALKFAKTVVETRGKVSDEDFSAVKNAGFSDGEIAEIVAHVALNVLTNYLNNVANTDIDFPKVEVPLKRATTA